MRKLSEFTNCFLSKFSIVLIPVLLTIVPALIILISCEKHENQKLIVHSNNMLMNTQLDVTVNGKSYHFENNGWDTIIVANKEAIQYTLKCQKTALNANSEAVVFFEHQTNGVIHTAFCPSNNGTVTGEFKYK